jgi:hypothetical protein
VIDPKTVLLAIPSHTGSITSELAGMLVNYGHRYFGGLMQPTECSHPSLVRNIIADTFLRSPFEWLVGIDSDIVAGPKDFEYLLQATNPEIKYFTPGDGDGDCDPGAPPCPSRVEITTWRSRIEPDGTYDEKGFSERTMADVLVNCEYAYKREPFEPVQFGLGFYRVHRSVFSVLQQLKHRDNGRVEMDRAAWDAFEGEISNEAPDAVFDVAFERLKATFTSQTDQPRLWQATYQGRVFHDYYPSGPITDLHVPNGQWKGEDHGFWTLCHLAGLVPRIETRTRLLHMGRKAYPYEGPDLGGGQ